MAAGVDMSAPQVFDQRVVTRIFRHDVKIAGWVGSLSTSDVISDGKIEGVIAARSEAHQLHRGGVCQKFFNQ